MAEYFKKCTKPSVSCTISIKCNHIAGYLEKLADYIEKRPWYGIEANYFREEIKKKKAEEKKKNHGKTS